MMYYAVQLASAFAGSLGFALLFHVRREKLLLASLGGLLAWGVYLLMGWASDQDVVRYFAASVVLTVYAEVLARLVKCPATLFWSLPPSPSFPAAPCTAPCSILWRATWTRSPPRPSPPSCWRCPSPWGCCSLRLSFS